MPRLTDLWRTGIVRAPIGTIMSSGFEGQRIEWLEPGPSFTFLADPFGLWRDDMLYLFVEAFDYRDRHGRIDVLRLDSKLRLIDRVTCLEESWHLSYPQVFEAEGATWMLPEAHRSGGLRLYHAVRFPDWWQEVARIELDVVPVDATLLRHDDRWWLFYTAATDRRSKISALHVAYADRLIGPWHPHRLNPVRIDPASARPGGRPVKIDGHWMLPMQDCSRTYGGAIRMLRIEELSPASFLASVGEPIGASPTFAPYVEGLHTLSACGDVTLFDAKRIEHSPRGLLIDARRRMGELLTVRRSAS